jgi:hypothetical protein
MFIFMPQGNFKLKFIPKDNGGGQSMYPLKNEMEDEENTSIDIFKNTHNGKL